MRCRRWRGFDRRTFDAEITKAIEATPAGWPKTVWREALAAEAWRIADGR